VLDWDVVQCLLFYYIGSRWLIGGSYMLLTIGIIGVRLLQFRWGPVVTSGGATELLPCRKLYLSRPRPSLPSDQAVGISHHGGGSGSRSLGFQDFGWCQTWQNARRTHS
jgi:hypothetical protein